MLLIFQGLIMSDGVVPTCGAWVGPIWKLDGETCVCMLPPGHVERGEGPAGGDHVCSCGSWFVDSVAHPREEISHG
jgi:hypothetical protein